MLHQNLLHGRPLEGLTGKFQLHALICFHVEVLNGFLGGDTYNKLGLRLRLTCSFTALLLPTPVIGACGGDNIISLSLAAACLRSGACMHGYCMDAWRQ